MSRARKAAAVAVLSIAGAALSVPEANADGWHRHRRHHHHHHRHLPVQSYEPQYERALGFAWIGCGMQQFVTRYGALAYRRVCLFD